MMKAWGVTDTGLVRKENQDAYAVCQADAATVCVVCDGMGGVSGGKLASSIAVRTYSEELLRVLRPHMTPEQLREMDGEPVWCEWLLDADRRIEYGAWFIVVVGEYGLELKKPLDFGCYVCKNENYGTEWLAYRRPPEGELKYDGRL